MLEDSIRRFRGSSSLCTIFQPGTHSCNKVKVNQDGDLAFVSSHNQIYGYNLFTETCFHIYEGHDGMIEDFDIDSKSKYLLSVGSSKTAYIHEIESGNVYLAIEVNKMMRCCSISPMGSVIAVVTSTQLKQEPVLMVYHFSQGKAILKFSVTFDKPVGCIMYSSDNTIICGDDTGRLLFVNTENCNSKQKDNASKAIIKVVNAHRGAINSIRMSWDRKFFATASADTSAAIWSVSDCEKLGSFPHSFLVSSVALSPIANHIVLASSMDKKNVATHFGASDFTINFFNLIFQNEFASMKVFKSPVNDVVFTPDGLTLIVTSQEGTFMIIRLGEEYLKACKASKNEEEALKREI